MKLNDLIVKKETYIKACYFTVLNKKKTKRVIRRNKLIPIEINLNQNHFVNNGL